MRSRRLYHVTRTCTEKEITFFLINIRRPFLSLTSASNARWCVASARLPPPCSSSAGTCDCAPVPLSKLSLEVTSVVWGTGNTRLVHHFTPLMFREVRHKTQFSFNTFSRILKLFEPLSARSAPAPSDILVRPDAITMKQLDPELPISRVGSFTSSRGAFPSF